MSNGSRLLEVLLKVSEKAANIARACRQNDTLFKLLVQEKSEEEKNPRFFQDFKTLADVLIQETIRHDIGIEFPELAKKVKGEESNVFSNALGETVIVQVYPSPEETTQLLIKVLNNDTATATLLASEVHKKISLEDVPVSGSLVEDFNIDMDDLGIWIDPIDSTADYINGIELMDSVGKIHLSGLRCVTVLIGAYLGSTGLPVLGVVNQPFYTQNNQSWTGICYWGSVNGDVGESSLKHSKLSSGVVVLSRSEDPEVKAKLSNGGFSIVQPIGGILVHLNPYCVPWAEVSLIIRNSWTVQVRINWTLNIH
ncbi:inositol polyphosphate 1-phosphatase isoform X2 [Cephus cinctus]|uniref:inositol-1,4-bisphosphate 1-phosphatase n=1 Tax=Cephus cinctus TaxID=211228 RepID=A0AAJ7BL75_CEPCN|nr:inositol polyphosphate 1-phosphatase isoform X2 [Cephus cinctus]